MFDPIDANHRSWAFVGRFLQEWSFLESAIHNALQLALSLDNLQRLIVQGNMQLRDKIHVLRITADLYLVDSDAVKKALDKMLVDISEYSATRNMMAHTMFGATDDGLGVQFMVVKAKDKLDFPTVVWGEADFLAAYKKIDFLTGQVEFLTQSFHRVPNLQSLVRAVSEQPTRELPPLSYLRFLNLLPQDNPDSDTDPAKPETSP